MENQDRHAYIHSGNRAPAEVKEDDLAYLIQAGLKAAWDSAQWPGPGADGSLDSMSSRAEELLLELEITKRRIKAARLILRSLYPENEKYQNEHWPTIGVLDNIYAGRCAECEPRVAGDEE